MDRVCLFPFPASKGKDSKKRLRGHSQSKVAGGKERERFEFLSDGRALLKKNPALGGHHQQQHERGRDGKKLIGESCGRGYTGEYMQSGSVTPSQWNAAASVV